MREKTHAHRNYKDSVTPEIKKERLIQLINGFHNGQLFLANLEINRFHLILIDGKGKKQNQYKGRTDTNKIVVIDINTVIG